MKLIECGTVLCAEKVNETRRVRGVIVYGNYSDMYIARFPDENLPSDGDLNLDELCGERIPLDHIFPIFDADTFRLAPDPLPDYCYTKLVNTMIYAIDGRRDNKVSELTLHEALACEDLSRCPHPNIALYLGCQVINKRIVALCFKKYKYTLYERIENNRNGLDKDRCVKDIQSGIEHIHRAGYAHNDINPSNIMFDEDGKAVIIDFDSCRKLGHKLGMKTGTKGFYDKNATTSEKQNDYHSFTIIKHLLSKT